MLSPTIWGYAPFLLAVCTAFTNKKLPTLLCLLAGFVASYYLQLIESNTLFLILFIFAMAASMGTHPLMQRQAKIRYPCYALLTLWSVALFLHLVPGFHNIELLQSVKASAHSRPFSMWLNLDNLMMFFTLWLALPHLFGQKKHSSIIVIALISLLSFALLLIAKALGAIAFEPSLPQWTLFFALNNLLIVSVAEEAFFRGFIQQGLSKKMPWIAALLIASVLFGLRHWQGGALLMMFSGVAGLFYGLMFKVTGRLWASVLLHFGLNMAHLLLFTYPVLARQG